MRHVITREQVFKVLKSGIGNIFEFQNINPIDLKFGYKVFMLSPSSHFMVESSVSVSLFNPFVIDFLLLIGLFIP